jgi:hypothetical protein
MINDDECKTIKKVVKRFSGQKIHQSNDLIRGSFKIVNFRKYDFNHEIDIEFIGEIFARINPNHNGEWFSSEIYNQKGFSKIKITKAIRRRLFIEVKVHSSYFGIKVKVCGNIKKIIWK